MTNSEVIGWAVAIVAWSVILFMAVSAVLNEVAYRRRVKRAIAAIDEAELRLLKRPDP